jgi:transposase
VVVMESTGIYWKSPHACLEKAGLNCIVVNAHHVKNVPGRKTDIADPEWLAMLTRAGLLKPSFVPPEKLRRLRPRLAPAPERTGSVRCWPTPASASAWW